MTEGNLVIRGRWQLTLVSLPNKDGNRYYINFPKVVLESVCGHYDDLFKQFPDPDHVFAELTKEELELFEAISFIYYKKHIDPDQELMVSLSYKHALPTIDNMIVFCNKIDFSKKADKFSSLIYVRLKSIIIELFNTFDIQLNARQNKEDLSVFRIDKCVDMWFFDNIDQRTYIKLKENNIIKQ